MFGTIFIDNEKANTAIDDTTKKGETAGKKVGSAFGSIAKGAAAVGTAVVAGASTLAAGAYKMASDTSTAANEVDKMSQKLGMSREAYQEWDYVLSQAGVEITSMSTGLKTLTNKLDDAKNGSDKAQAMFSKLGLSSKELESMSREEVFNAVINGMQGMEDSTERAALANDLFGKSGQELTALFNTTAASTEEMKNKAHDLGMVMSNETVDSGVKFVDTMDTMKRAGEGIFNSVGGALLPIIQQLAEKIIEYMPTIRNIISQLTPIFGLLFSQLLPPLLQLATDLFPIITDLIMQLLPVCVQIITAILPVITQLLNLLLPPILQIIQMVLPLLIDLIMPLLPLLSPIFELLSPLINLLLSLLEPLLSLINLILPPIISLISNIAQKVLPVLQSILSATASVLTSVFSGAFESFKKIFTNVKNIFQGLIDFVKNVFTGNWSEAWDNIVSIFSNIFASIKEAFKIPINWIIDGINAFINGINKIQIPDWVPELGGKGLNIPTIARLRIGMEYVPYDDFPALLHKGERVLTAGESKEYNSERQSSGNSSEVNTLLVSEVKKLRSDLYDIIVNALVRGVNFEWKERELARLVKNYAN